MKNEKINFHSDLINLSRARDFISDKAKEAGADESDLTKIEISCDEWCANIIEHALGNNEGKGFTIECREESGRFIVVYEHEGSRFNPIEQDDVDISSHFSQSKERGLGIYIMKEMMDEIHYDYLDGKTNRLTLVKYLGSS
jgi:anti-sigma regulatory factor (Ser/Thr protein kinase)